MDRIGLDNTRAERRRSPSLRQSSDHTDMACGLTVLTAEDASLIALELNFDPVIDDEAAFDIYPAYEISSSSFPSLSRDSVTHSSDFVQTTSPRSYNASTASAHHRNLWTRRSRQDVSP